MALPSLVRIIVVEDSLPDVMLLREALKEQHVLHELIHYRDGAEAVAKLNDPVEPKTPPNLIVLDLNMPKMGGLEVLAYLRKTGVFDQVPIAILTSSLQPEEQARAHTLGADRFIRKPIDLHEYLSEVGTTLRDLLATPKNV